MCKWPLASVTLVGIYELDEVRQTLVLAEAERESFSSAGQRVPDV